jgi:trans-2,3-dihydro-3-hydroxyanthranilate isomerase
MTVPSPHDYVVADVFSETPLEGNPVAVFLDGSGISAAQMQRVAREMNLSETTFVLPARQGADARIRIFTPVNELPFAGHPMLGTAIVLGALRAASTLRLETAMGVIPVDLHRGDERVGYGRMRQPVPTWTAYEHADELLAALGLEDSTLPVEAYRNGPTHVFVGVPSGTELAGLEPDQRALARLPDMAANCFTGTGVRWRMRMFSPAYGVTEDPATGSAAGPLAVHLARHGRIDYGQRIEIRQGVEIGRPSTMFAGATGAGDRIDAVEVAGAAVVVGKGALRI